MADKDYSEAVLTVNMIQKQLSNFARVVVGMLKDGKISGTEGMMIALYATNMGGAVVRLIESSPEQRADILYVLEHGEWKLES